MTGRGWDWLDGPLPLDLANTWRRTGPTYHDRWRTGADVASWSEIEGSRVPNVSASEAEARLDELRAFRDDVFATLRAASTGRHYPRSAAERVNAVARSHPAVEQLRPQPGKVLVTALGSPGPVDELIALCAHATIAFTSTADAGRVVLCDAPGCGGFFLRDRTNQQWCSDSCGTRARVARHNEHRGRQPHRGGLTG